MRKMSNKKQLLNRLSSYETTILEKEYLRSLVELDITPFDDNRTLKKLELTGLSREILRYNLFIKSVEAITHDYNPKEYKLLLDKGYDFNMSLLRKEKIYNLINMNFDNDVILTIHDRTNIEKLLEEKRKKLEELKDYYHDCFYIYFGALNSPEEKIEEKRVLKEIKILKYEIERLEELHDLSEIVEYDRRVKESLHIPETKNEIILKNGIETTSIIHEAGRVKVLKQSFK